MEFLIFLVVAALTVIPLFKMMPAFGLNPYWSFVAIVPLGVIVLLWVMAARLDRLRGGGA